MKKGVKALFPPKKTNTFLVFLVLSLLFSVLTKLSKDYTATLILETELINVPKDKVILEDSTNTYMELTLKTYGFKWLRYYLNKPKIQLDVSAMEDADNTYFWERQEGYSSLLAQFDQNVTLASVAPETMLFSYDQNTVKKVPVVFQGELQFKDGYNSTQGVQLVPDSMEVIGPSTLLQDIDEVMTKSLEIDDIDASLNQPLSLNLSTPNDQLQLSQDEVMMKLDVERFTEGTLSIPIEVKNVPDDVAISFFPKEVKVRFLSSLDNFKLVKASDFVIECDYTKLGRESTYFVPELSAQPSIVKKVRIATRRIDYIISQ